jgi:N-methylhydantoinase A
VVLGRIGARQFLGGEMSIDPARAAAAVDRIARALGTNRTRAAQGIVEVANANMERAIRAISIQRGYDPREFALVAFGGCGALHACDIAGQLGMRTVIVPHRAGVLSAYGMLVADRVRDYSCGALGRSDLGKRFAALERAARRECPGADLDRMADIRYAGQSYELTVAWEPDDPAAPFHREHRRVYGYARPGQAVEVVTLRLRARARVARRKEPSTRAVTPREAAEYRRVYSGGARRRTPVFRREEMGRRTRNGPALVIDYGSTALAPPGWAVRVDRNGALILRRRGDRRP